MIHVVELFKITCHFGAFRPGEILSKTWNDRQEGGAYRSPKDAATRDDSIPAHVVVCLYRCISKNTPLEGLLFTRHVTSLSRPLFLVILT